MKDTNDIDHVTRTAAHLSVIEIAIGSVVHGLKLPLAGHTLSLNQGFFLTHALRLAHGRINAAQQSIEISSVSSVLKSLSPAGNKIGPMLSIATQGLLYSVGILLLGRRLAGQMLAMALLSLWAFVQPLITLFIIHGQLEKVLGFYWQRINNDLPQISSSLVFILGFFVSVKLVLAISIPILIYYLGPEKVSALENKILLKNQMVKVKPRAQNQSPIKGAIKDMTQPLFLFSMVLVVSYFFLTESNYVHIFWLCLRPIAIAFILFYLVRSPRFIQLLARLATKNNFCKKIYDRTLLSQVYIQTWLSK